MDSHWVDRCLFCDAELKTWEAIDHVKACLKIEAKTTGRSSSDTPAQPKAEPERATPFRPFPPSAHPWFDGGEPGYDPDA